MSIRISALLLVSLVGCASQPTVNYNPISQIKIDCRQAVPMSADLQTIILNPNIDIKRWAGLFAGLSGYSTPDQKVSSAKTVLWTIRTSCPGS